MIHVADIIQLKKRNMKISLRAIEISEFDQEKISDGILSLYFEEKRGANAYIEEIGRLDDESTVILRFASEEGKC